MAALCRDAATKQTLGEACIKTEQGDSVQGGPEGQSFMQRRMANLADISGDASKSAGLIPGALFEQRGMLLQPLLGGFKVRADASHFLPEPGRVVHLAQVHQFMKDDVVAD